MNESLPPTGTHISNPTQALETYYRQLAAQYEQQPSFNRALQVAAIDFCRHQGDWLGVMLTPWFLDFFLLPGNGTLWGDIPSGQKRYIDLPGGTLPFIARTEPGFGPIQHSPLIAPVSQLDNQAAALQLAHQAHDTLLGTAPRHTATSPPETQSPPLSRRAFLRRLTGR